MNDNFIRFFQKNLNKLKNEISAYPTEESVWKVAPGIINSTGVITCHLVGNLHHFIGHALGNTGYVRNRELEFTPQTDVFKADLIKMIDEASEMLTNILGKIDNFQAPYPSGLWPWECDIHYAMLQLLSHFTWHLGQVNYHRRLLT